MAYTYTLDDVEALKQAIATGATLVKFGSGADSREVRYRSLAEMRSILADMMAEVQPSPSNAIRTSFIAHSRD